MTEHDNGAGPNVRHSRYLLVESKVTCPQCNGVTAVFALALPEGYESFNADDDSPDERGGAWESPGMPAVLSYVEYLPEAVASRIRDVTSRYRLDHDSAGGAGFWSNHCEHCRAKIEEETLHGDLDSPFGPCPALGLEAVQVQVVREPFEARVGAESHDVKPMNG